jgi:hypothetical protein
MNVFTVLHSPVLRKSVTCEREATFMIEHAVAAATMTRLIATVITDDNNRNKISLELCRI